VDELEEDPQAESNNALTTTPPATAPANLLARFISYPPDSD
jgi:hypothetical protein